MFLALEDATHQWWLTLLLVVWGIFLIGGFLFGRLNAEHTHRMPTWMRMASSITLVIAGWNWWLITRDTAATGFALAVAVGMTLGCAGDFFMARLVPLKAYVLGGMAAFGLGHLVYIVGFMTFGNQSGLAANGIRWDALIVWWLIGGLGWYLVVFRDHKASVLHYAALPYALLLATTAGVATGLALQSLAFIWLAIGTALFLLSDLLLAAQLFNRLHFRMIGDVVWLLYGPAQLLIVYSVATALLIVR
jgi:YhhN family